MHCRQVQSKQNSFLILHKVCVVLDEKRPSITGENYEEFMTVVSDRPGHDQHYTIDLTKIMTELGWKFDKNFNSSIVKIVK